MRVRVAEVMKADMRASMVVTVVVAVAACGGTSDVEFIRQELCH